MDPWWWTKWNINDEFQDRIFRKNFWELKSRWNWQGICLLFGFDWEGRVSLGLTESQEGWPLGNSFVHFWNCIQNPGKQREDGVGEVLIARFWIQIHPAVGSVTWEHGDKQIKRMWTEILWHSGKEIPKQPQAICFTQRENSIYYTINHRLNTYLMAVITQRAQDKKLKHGNIAQKWLTTYRTEW